MIKVISTYRIFIFFFVIFFISNSIFSQENFPINGVEDNRENHYAFSNAKIFLDISTAKNNFNLKELNYTENKSLVLIKQLKIKKKDIISLISTIILNIALYLNYGL